jgi:dTDP-4-amino-4,6-dideoxygalactose transaminase
MYRHGQEEIDAVTQVLKSGNWFRYPKNSTAEATQATLFEKECAELLNIPHTCFTSSGTAALLCCYAGLNLGPGDEVIVPGYTWIATALAPLALGVIPVLVDIDESLTLDPDAVERAITPRTKAICTVHMNGFASNMDRLLQIAKRHNLFLIEDACQCDGGLWKDGRYLGTLGDMGAYSFNYYKVISCGDGGMFVTGNRQAYERGLIYHDAGAMFRPNAKELGVEFFAGINLRGNEILASIMRVQLTRLKGIVRDLHRVHDAISERVQESDEISPMPYNGGIGTGTRATLGYRFRDEKSARAFCSIFNQDTHCGATASLPIDSGRHVYTNWEPVLMKRGSYHAKSNPYTHALNQGSSVTYSKDMLPRTLEILKSTILIPINPEWQDAEIANVSAAINAVTEKTQQRSEVVQEPAGVSK